MANNAIRQKDEEIDELLSFINTLRIERIRDNAYACLEALRHDFEQLDTLTRNFNKAKNDYYTERKHNPDNPQLSEMKAAKENLSTLVSAKEKEMVKAYNCNACHGLGLTIYELRNALHYHIG